MDRSVQAALGSTLDDVVLVSGPAVHEIYKDNSTARFSVVPNETPELGMSNSIRLGLSSVELNYDGAMILLGDQPFVTSHVLNHFIERWKEDPDRILIPTINGRRTQPVIFPKSTFGDLMGLKGDVGGRSIVNSNPQLLTTLDVTEIYDDHDIDDEDDLAHARRVLES